MFEIDTEQLIEMAQTGDSRAQHLLLTRHRPRLRRMIGVFLDPRLMARVDASDILQEALTVAAQRLPQYLEDRPIAFYPWLRQFVRNELVNIHRRHILAQRRSVGREQPFGSLISDASAMQLADRLVSREASPSQNAQAEELREQVKAALASLSNEERELLLMRCSEQLGVDEISDILGITESAARSRITRTLQKLHRHLGANP